MASDIKIVVRDNVRALLRLSPTESGVSKLIDLGIPNGSAQRVLKGETSVGLDVMSELARVLKVSPWQLCVPGIDPDRLPDIEPRSFRWPFRQIDPEAITNLVGTKASAVEQGLLIALAAAGVSPRKRDGTNG